MASLARLIVQSSNSAGPNDQKDLFELIAVFLLGMEVAKLGILILATGPTPGDGAAWEQKIRR